MHRARAASPAQSVLLPLALVAATFVVVAGLIVIAVAPPTLVYVLDWVRDTRVEGVAVTGELLTLAESQNVYTIDGTLPADVPRLVDAADVCTGLYQQTATAVACVPFSVENATMNFALQPVGAGAALAVNGTNHVRGLLANGTADVSLTQINDDVLLTVDIPADVAWLCGTSCGPGDVLAVAPNGTCLLCNTGVQAASVMRTCGTCPQFASVRLAANSSCYECLSIPASSVFNGGGDVGTQLRSNDTLVYSVMPQPLTDHVSSTVGLSSYTYQSGWYKLTTFPVDYPGNSQNLTVYQIDIGTNLLVSASAGNATTQVYVLFDFQSLVPGWVSTPFEPQKSTVTGSVTCWSVPNPAGAWFVFFGANWAPGAVLNSEYELINAPCYLQYSVFWVNG